MSDLTAELDKLVNAYEETLNTWANIPVFGDKPFEWTDESLEAAKVHDDATAALCRFVVQHKHELMDALAETSALRNALLTISQEVLIGSAEDKSQGNFVAAYVRLAQIIEQAAERTRVWYTKPSDPPSPAPDGAARP